MVGELSSTERSFDGAGEEDRRRTDYERELAGLLARGMFCGPRAGTCPWCGDPGPRFRARLVDTRQCKPGVFHMDECRSCGHVFQNPRLTSAALAYYCRDSYDGLGRDHYASMAEYSRSAQRARVRLVTAHRRPTSWLDVGARQGHLCREARRMLPGTRVTALDPSPEVLRARDRGWTDEADQRPLTRFAEDHPGEFDVVSLVHYAERTADPRAQFAAARRLLRPGGVVLIEQVNPLSRYADLHGRYWYCWLAPQNLHLMPADNVCGALGELGFTVADVRRGAANKPFDNVAALLTALNHRLPPARSWPWSSRRASGAGRAARTAAMVLAAPALALALAVDSLLQPLISRGGGGNAYRIVAVAR
ncbi:class I SAM-dependent methyltransferase [Saccharomonospora xinjiangensis]